MQISVESGEGLERRMQVLLPVDEFNATVEQRLKKISRTARLDGFRPGKVPLSVIKKRFGAGVQQEVFGELVQSSFYEAATKEGLKPAGEPQIEALSENPEDSIGYMAIFEVMPEVEIGDIAGFQVEKIVGAVSDEDIDGMMTKLQKQRVEWNEVNRPSQSGDQLKISFVGRINGAEFNGGSANDVSIELGSGMMVEDFETGLEGAGPGEERTITVTFPEDYQSPSLANQTAEFEVTVFSVSEPKLPEIDEEFVKSLGVDDGAVETLRSDIRSNMERELEQASKSKTKNSVMETLLREHAISIPQAMIVRESEALRDRAREEMKASGRESSVELPLDVFKDQAARRVKLGLLINKMIADNEMKADAERVKETVESMASTYENPDEVVSWYYSNKEQMAALEALVLEEQVVDWILDKAVVTEKSMTFDELMVPTPQA